MTKQCAHVSLQKDTQGYELEESSGRIDTWRLTLLTCGSDYGTEEGRDKKGSR